MTQITSTQLLVPVTREKSQADLLQSLQVGQVLRATALSENIDGTVRLQIGAVKLNAQTLLATQVGQRLTLEVKQLAPLPELKLLVAPDLSALKADALKSILPRQQGLEVLMSQLLGIADADISPPSPLGRGINAVLEQLLAAGKPGFRDMLAQALQRSGLLTEGLLLRGEAQGGDLKLNLLRLFTQVQTLLTENAQLRPSEEQPKSADLKTLSDLLKSIDGALARIQAHQLASLKPEHPAAPLWQFELPIRYGENVDLLQFLLKKEASKGDEEKTAAWNLTLVSNMSALGPLRIQLRLQADEIGVLICAREERTLSRALQHLDRLQHGLEQAGLKVTQIRAQQGQVERLEPLPNNLSLLHERV